MEAPTAGGSTMAISLPARKPPLPLPLPVPVRQVHAPASGRAWFWPGKLVDRLPERLQQRVSPRQRPRHRTRAVRACPAGANRGSPLPGPRILGYLPAPCTTCLRTINRASTLGPSAARPRVEAAWSDQPSAFARGGRQGDLHARGPHPPQRWRDSQLRVRRARRWGLTGRYSRCPPPTLDVACLRGPAADSPWNSK
jgi:hypothetical protein